MWWCDVWCRFKTDLDNKLQKENSLLNYSGRQYHRSNLDQERKDIQKAPDWRSWLNDQDYGDDEYMYKLLSDEYMLLRWLWWRWWWWRWWWRICRLLSSFFSGSVAKGRGGDVEKNRGATCAKARARGPETVHLVQMQCEEEQWNFGRSVAMIGEWPPLPHWLLHLLMDSAFLAFLGRHQPDC